MPSIDRLIEGLPEISQSRLVAAGYGVWVAWKGELHNVVDKTLQEYGVFCVARDKDQSLWFCNSTEVFRAVARLQVWSRVNKIPVIVQLVPLTLLVGYDLDYTVSMAPELDHQQVTVASSFDVYVHPKLKEKVQTIHGLSTESAGIVDGMANVEWQRLVADQQRDYESQLGWYFVIKPLGKMSDKESILGWRDFSQEIIELLQRLSLKYISDVKEGVLFFPLDNFRLLRSFCLDIMNLIRKAKEDPDKKDWPVIMVAEPQGELNFSADLPKKIGLDWNRLSPDFPHVHFMDALLLSEWFHMNEVQYGTKQVSLESWCTISLKDGGQKMGGYGTMQVQLPSALLSETGTECFYCGLKNHEPEDCPSKCIPTPQPQVWHLLAKTDIKDFSKGFSELDEKVGNGDFTKSMCKLLSEKNDLPSLMARTVFEVNVHTQLRTVQLVWRSRSKEWEDGFKQLAPKEEDSLWEAVAAMERHELAEAEELVRDAQTRSPRNYQPQSLWGFWYLERGDYNQAMFHWQEAERMAFTPLQQGYMIYLQARLLEVDGNLKDAINAYKRVNVLAHSWREPIYRQAVCLVKMGFPSQALDQFMDLITRDPNTFNRILVDPELDRGRVQLMNALWERWVQAEEAVEEARKRVGELTEDIGKRFDENHSYFETANEDLDRLRRLGDTKNYVAYHMLIRGVEQFKGALDREVSREVRRINGEIEHLSDRVRDIQREAAWFPFPKLLLEFNKEFNFCVDKINWIRTQHLPEADNFRKSLRLLDDIDSHLNSLQKRLVTLRIVRDSTLFVLMLGRNFIWLELIGLALLLIAVPSLLYFGRDMKGNPILDMLNDPSQRWEISKGMVLILSVVCLAFATIKSALTFERRKRKLFDKLDEEIRKDAPRRY